MSNASPSLIPPREPRGFSRLFPMERRSLRKTIADSGLSKEAQEIIRKVLCRSRLWRFEKIEVAQELISHFQDGELAGKSYSQLVANFGDPDLTAKLIRRSKIRNRPIMMKFAQLFGWVFFAVVAAYLSMWSYYHSGVPTPSVDFLPEFNGSAVELPQEDRAWNVYRPVWTEFQFCEGGEFWRNIDALYKQVDQDRRNRQLRPTDPEWAGTVAKLSEIQELLDSFREGSRIERLGFEFQADPNLYSDADFACLFPHLDRTEADKAGWISSDDLDPEVHELLKNSVLGITLPHVQPMRTAGRLLTIDSHWAIEQGDTDRVVDNIRAMYGLGWHASDTNMLVGSLVGFAIVGQAFELIEELIPVHIDEFTDEQLKQIQDLTAQVRLDEFFGDLAGERALMLDLIQRTFTDNGKGDGRITPHGLEMLELATGSRQKSWMETYPEFPTVMMVAENLAAPASLFVMASRKETIRKYEEIMDLFKRDMQLPYWEAEHFDYGDLIGEQAMRYRVLDSLMPAQPQIRRAKDLKIGRQEGVIAAIASHRFFKANGEWPESLTQLAPDFVVELPFDIVTGEPLNLIANEDGVTIYSVGNDREDDGGELPIMIYTNSEGKVFHHPQTNRGYVLSPHADSSRADGDWILWPKQEEDQ